MQVVDQAMFLELEQESGRPLNVMRPVPSNGNMMPGMMMMMPLPRSSFQVQGTRRRSGRVKSVKHRRSWSVGGSNVHRSFEMMMKTTDSPLNRLSMVKTSEPKKTSGSSSSQKWTRSRDTSDTHSQRGSSLATTPTTTTTTLIDTGTQTEVIQVVRRSKGDGISLDSPSSMRLKHSNVHDGHQQQQQKQQSPGITLGSKNFKLKKLLKISMKENSFNIR